MIGGTRGNPGTGHLEEILISPRVHQTPEAFGFEESVRIPMCQPRLITRCSEAREFVAGIRSQTELTLQAEYRVLASLLCSFTSVPSGHGLSQE
jgi:hypothetical protein